MTYARLKVAEPESGQILRLILDDDQVIRVIGTKKQLRKAVSGGNLDNISVIYNQNLCMSKEDWALVQPLLLAKDFGPILNQQLKLSYEELSNLPRWAWKGGLRSYGGPHQRLFTYHPVNFRRMRNPEGRENRFCDMFDELHPEKFDVLYGMIREINFPEDGQMTLWRIKYHLKDKNLDIETGIQPNEYFI